MLPDGDPGINGVTYRIAFDKSERRRATSSKAAVVWTIRGVAGGRGGGRGPRRPASRYVVSGAGAEPEVTVAGNTISLKGILPLELSGASGVVASADAATGTPSVGRRLGGRASGAARRTFVHPRWISRHDEEGRTVPRRVRGIPLGRDSARAGRHVLGHHGARRQVRLLRDVFRFSRRQPRGRHAEHRSARRQTYRASERRTNGLENYCSQGQLQWMFVEPVSTSAVQIQERSPDGRMTDYNYAMSQIGHELGHRWAADARALVNGETITLGPVHWATGVHLPAAFPYSNPVEADAMGGSTWKDNGDGTYTQLDRDYYSPAKGYSWLALYLMGLAKPDEVPPFFILAQPAAHRRSRTPTGIRSSRATRRSSRSQTSSPRWARACRTSITRRRSSTRRSS